MVKCGGVRDSMRTVLLLIVRRMSRGSLVQLSLAIDTGFGQSDTGDTVVMAVSGAWRQCVHLSLLCLKAPHLEHT
jgi:hypothetical protein